MTARSFLVASAALVLSLASVPASAGWGPDGATIKSTTSNIPKISAASDGGFGSIVAWQEESSPGVGILRAQHVLPTGDVDPAWNADGVVLCNIATARIGLGVIPDQQGGAYVWWKETTMIFMTRVTSAGAVAANWPARGRLLGRTWYPGALPSVVADGSGGVYACWSATSTGADPTLVYAMHLGPGNTGAGGWPNGVRLMSTDDLVPTIDYWPQIAVAPDGGAFVAWATQSDDPEVMPSVYRLKRVTSAGLTASGWPSEGLELGAFEGEWVDPQPQRSMIGVADDDRGGVFAMIGFLDGEPGQQTYSITRLFRRQADGTTAPDWPAEGVVLTGGAYADGPPEASHRVFADGMDGAQVGLAALYDHATDYSYAATLPSGGWKPSSSASGLPSQEVVRNRNGGVFFASFYPKGPSTLYEPYAHLRVDQSLAPPGWTDFSEVHFELSQPWFGDIALAESGDGGAVFFWSQVHQRFGLFARRFNGAGQVTAVETRGPVAATLALSRLRFVTGEGVAASLVLPAGEGADLDLFDVSGRRLAWARIDASGGARDVVIPGTRGLAAGLYFARVATLRESASGKVIVAR